MLVCACVRVIESEEIIDLWALNKHRVSSPAGSLF